LIKPEDRWYNTGSNHWTAYSSNVVGETVNKGETCLAIQYVDSTAGGRTYLNKINALLDTLKNGREYRIRFKSRITTGTVGVWINHWGGNGVTAYLTNSLNWTNWRRLTVKGVSGYDGTTPFFRLNGLGPGETLFLTDLSIRIKR